VCPELVSCCFDLRGKKVITMQFSNALTLGDNLTHSTNLSINIGVSFCLDVIMGLGRMPYDHIVKLYVIS